MIAYILTRATDRLRSHTLAESLGVDYRLICDNVQQADRLKSHFKIKSKRIIVTEGSPGPPCGAAYARNFVMTQVAKKNEWLIWLDDNVSHLTAINPTLSKSKLDMNDSSVNWRKEFSEIATPKTVLYYCDETIEEAEAAGTINCGFATEDNFFFRGNKWQRQGYCRTQFGLYKNDGSGWMPTADMMFEDMYKSVDVVARYGSVVINRHMKPIKPAFEAGGIGSLEQRIPWLTKNCQWLMQKYPGLLALSKGRQYHVTFAKRSQNTVDQWRKQHGYL